jgi:hypothetical protein
MACNAIRNYSASGVNDVPVRGAPVTGIVGKNAYHRLADGRFMSATGVILTSGYANKLLLKPNGSRAASHIYGKDEAALCCG